MVQNIRDNVPQLATRFYIISYDPFVHRYLTRVVALVKDSLTRERKLQENMHTCPPTSVTAFLKHWHVSDGAVIISSQGFSRSDQECVDGLKEVVHAQRAWKNVKIYHAPLLFRPTAWLAWHFNIDVDPFDAKDACMLLADELGMPSQSPRCDIIGHAIDMFSLQGVRHACKMHTNFINNRQGDSRFNAIKLRKRREELPLHLPFCDKLYTGGKDACIRLRLPQK